MDKQDGSGTPLLISPIDYTKSSCHNPSRHNTLPTHGEKKFMATTNHLLNRGIQRHLAGDLEGSKEEYRKILQKDSDHTDGLHLLGLTEYQSGNPDKAEPLIRQAIALNANVPAFHGNLGSILVTLGRPEEAMGCYIKSVELDPKFIDGWKNLGNLASRLNNHELAAQAFSAQAPLTHGKDGQCLGYLGLSLAVLCDWTNLDLTVQTILTQLPQLATPLPPFSTLIYDFSPAEQKAIADLAARFIHDEALRFTKGVVCKPRDLPAKRPKKLKIGYLGDDFLSHAVGYLFIGLMEAHTHKRFEIFIYSYAPPSDDPIRQRIIAAADHFVEIGPLNWAAAANKIHEDGIDILIDLKGHTGIPRGQILALRPAPIQIGWLGYPGTYGGSDVDFIIADPFVIPHDEEDHYSEKVARLPNCYQPNDPKRPRAVQPVDRAEVGLPQDAFVFGALNNTFKITPPMFDSWMTLLKDCPDSVLWLLDHHPKTQANLIAAATERGVAPERLIFAPRVDHAQHMIRLSACDVALDTFPYGGHTTTSDFLWAGVPVIALCGRTFASRVAGSLLHNVGLPELVTLSMEDYLALSKALYKDRKRLATYKARLGKFRDKSPLFDAAGFAKDFEKLLDDIYAQRLQ